MSLTCRHARTSLVRAWDNGFAFIAEQCDICGAVGPAPEGERDGDPFALPELDVKPLAGHGRDIAREIRRLQDLLRPHNPKVTAALAGARLNGDGR